ncbi:MAG: NAD-dependent epimerase/dehydratase family protein [Myxococcales bacterium]|nr:NAD-dependent epimerase/dehydratase family protein [Myxococcales bacterium]
MTSLVTGASGFLGGWLVRQLISRGESVRVLLRPESDRSRLAQEVEVCIGRLEDPSSLTAATTGVHYIYHCAALSTDWGPTAEFMRANVDGVENLLRAAHGNRELRRFVHVSSTDVYGYPRQVGDEEVASRACNLPYHRSKLLGERAIWRFAEQHGMPVTVVRPATIYGPHALSTVGEFARAIEADDFVWIAGGRPRAGLIYVEDVASAMVCAATSERALGRAYNLCDPRPTTWREYIEVLAAGIGARVGGLSLPGALAYGLAAASEVWARVVGKRRPLLTRHAVLLMARDQGYCSDRARRELGFESSVSFEEGMTRTLAWWNHRRAEFTESAAT